MTAVDLVIRHARVAAESRRPAARYPDLPREDAAARGGLSDLPAHSIGVRAGEIAWILPDGDVDPASFEGAEVIDASGHVAIPGLMNSHTHTPMVMFRGAASDVPTDEWFNQHVWPMEVNLTERDIRLGARLAIGELLLSGVTSFADHYFGMEAIAEEVEAAGIRALLASTFFSSEGPAGRERSVAFARDADGAAGGRITTALGPHAPYTVDDDDLRLTARDAERLGVRVHIHAAENLTQTASSLHRRGRSPIGVLHDTGILQAGAIIAHGAGIVPEDVDLLRPYADRVGVASCTKTYLLHAQEGTTPLRLLHDAGVSVGIGTDGAAGSITLDVLENMRLLGMIEKYTSKDATWATSAHLLDLATRQNAEVFGLAGRVGALRPGLRADIVLMDFRAPHLQPVHDLAHSLALSAHQGDVTTVIVDGRVVVRDRTLLTIDLEAAIDELTERLPALTDRSHGRRVQDYAP
ncbi:amidohydrolase [Microbacterium sp.]|uniref:amidohydrolase n=1 Tax=Microbacterium sp. TaxID=51671 RepID=UPI0025D30FCB|nr:amidohydrolase [Microbacterium sp.]